MYIYVYIYIYIYICRERWGWWNIKECSEFFSHGTKETFQINQYFNCNSNNDYLLRKSFLYEHHLKNYEESLKTGLIPNGLHQKKSARIGTATEDFYRKCHRKCQPIFYDTEKDLAELLWVKSSSFEAPNWLRYRNLKDQFKELCSKVYQY